METLRDTYFENLEDTYVTALDLMRVKNKDYARETDPFQNFRDSAMFAGVTLEQGILVRLADKFSRCRNLLERGETSGAVGEAITDTLLDAINYTAILKTYIDLGRPAPESKQMTLDFEEEVPPAKDFDYSKVVEESRYELDRQHTVEGNWFQKWLQTSKKS